MLLCSSVAWCEVPFRVTTVTKDGFAADTEWYTMAIGSSGLFISDNADKDFIAVKSNRSELADADLWCFAGDEKSGYKIYNKQAGPGKVLAAPTKMSGDAGSKAYVVLQSNPTRLCISIQHNVDICSLERSRRQCGGILPCPQRHKQEYCE